VPNLAKTVKLADFTVSLSQISLTRLQQIRRKDGAPSSKTGRMYKVLSCRGPARHGNNRRSLFAALALRAQE